MAKENIVMNKSLLIITILISISYNVYSQTFYTKARSRGMDDDMNEHVVLVYNKTNNTLRYYTASYDTVISVFVTYAEIGCIEFLIKNNKAIYNKSFSYKINDKNITIENEIVDKKDIEEVKKLYKSLKTEEADYLSLIELLIIADSILISDNKTEIAYKSYKRLVTQNDSKIPTWYYYFKNQLAEIN